ncbi:MAG: hypothetical protein K2Q06_03590, partial [Parvularculaceae bacterium]|nr:hypothetical protein [Parvularculaceae bacterium]
ANPFRTQTDSGRSSIGAALDMIRSLGAPAPRETPRTQQPSQNPAPRPQPRGDLFDEQPDAELEIPSFLRKKKTG